ncbi:MAG TPA: glycosyltransferase family 87 protein [Thermohalobaculum sp.]|nr:glycosyltransferase family 87 protein [Thermohalobaculum sp.]
MNGPRPVGPLADIERPLRRLGRFVATAAVLFLIAYTGGVVFVLTSGLVDSQTRQADFVAFWSAARLALEGNAIAAFDQDLLRQVQALPADVEEGELFWLYPPGVQLALAPFGLLPYWAAWVLFNVLSLAAFLGAHWRPARRVPMAHDLLIGAPIVVITLQLGQLLMFWASALVSAFRAMARGQCVLPGLLIGLLSLKPQLGILLPFALVAARRWDVILWATIWTVAVHAVPTLVVGLDYWDAFFKRLAAVSEALEMNLFKHHLMVSPYAFARFLGLGHAPAMASQVLVSAGLAASVFALWRRRDPAAGLGLPGGVLCMAVAAATPYAYYYELVFAIPGAILLVRGGYGRSAFDRVLLGLALLGPAVLWVWTPLSPLFAPVLVAIVVRATLLGLRQPDMAVAPVR